MNIVRLTALLFGIVTLTIVSCTSNPEAQNNDQVGLEDYERAEQMLSPNTSPLVYGDVSRISWVSDSEFACTISDSTGHKYYMVNVAEGSKELLFDHEKLANALSGETGNSEIDPNELSLGIQDVSDRNIQFSYRSDIWDLSLTDYSLQKNTDPRPGWTESLSPDGTKVAFIRDYNLWVRDLASGRETQLTFDGQEDYGYATNNAGWIKSDRPVLLWSPQSDKIATFRQDARNVGEMYLWSTNVGHPNLEQWKYPLPGDSAIFMIERLVIDLSGPNPRRIWLKIDPDAQRSTTTDHIAGRDGTFLDVEWSKDGDLLTFVSSSRDHKEAHFQTANPGTGVVRSVHKEVSPTYFESGDGYRNWRIIKNSNELIWFSEKSDWGHLYLHDLTNGELKNAITSGEWAVQQVQFVDEEKRQLYFIGSNKEDGNPYYNYLYRVDLDGNNLTLLTPEVANHSISWSPSRDYFIDSYSTPDTPPVTVIRSLDGREVMEVSTTDISALVASGWVPPTEFEVFARDSVTKLYGLMYKPSNFDETRSYPILNYLYPGPQSGSVGSRSFRASRGDKQAVAELGFIVVEVDAMGTPGRSKSFHDAYYGDMGDNGLPDQVGMIKQLAAQNEWMDINRVGIWGHSGGGFASTGGILRYPDFYKVAVSGAGNHDNRNYEDDWGEKWHGLLEKYSESTMEGTPVSAEVGKMPPTDNYDKQANQLLVNNLKGKLLIAHGMLDNNVHPSNTLLVVQALIEADKDFDMLVFPNARHGFGNSRYFMKRRWDYFVEHLKNTDPPEGFVFGENIR